MWRSMVDRQGRAAQTLVTAVIAVLREERERQGLSQRELAERMRATSPYVSNLEAGRVGVSLDKLVQWAGLLGLTVTLDLEESDVSA